MKKGFKFKGHHPCPYCDRVLPSPQSLSGHIQMTHAEVFNEWRAGVGLPAPEEREGAMGSPAPASSVPTSELRQRKNEVELLSLEKKRRELIRELGNGQPQQRYPDVSEVSGAGPLDPEVRRTIQGRMFEAQPREKEKPGWLEILNSPNLSLILSGLRGAMGGNQGDVSGVQAILSLLGVKNLREMVGSNQPVAVAPNDFDLPGVGRIPAGFPLDANLLTAMMTQTANKGRDELLANSLVSSVDKIASLIREERGGDGDRMSKQSEQQVITCPECGTQTPVPPNVVPGTQIKCANEACDQSFTAVDERSAKPKSQKPPKRRQVKLAEGFESEPIRCISCGQSLSTKNRQPGDEIVCPVCGESQILTTPDVPLEPTEPEPTALSEEDIYIRNQRNQRRQ